MTNDGSDYGKGVYGQVEAEWRTVPPPQDVIDRAMQTECPDCRCNVVIKEEPPPHDGVYRLWIAHDDTCPWLTRKRPTMTDRRKSGIRAAVRSLWRELRRDRLGEALYVSALRDVREHGLDEMNPCHDRVRDWIDRRIEQVSDDR